MIKTRDRLANGLCTTDIAMRPNPYVGMIWYVPATQEWVEVWDACCNRACYKEILLPGERGCPQVPPTLQRDWQKGDKAWLLSEEGWVKAEVTETGHFMFNLPAQPYQPWYRRLDTPAIWIPND